MVYIQLNNRYHNSQLQRNVQVSAAAKNDQKTSSLKYPLTFKSSGYEFVK